MSKLLKIGFHIIILLLSLFAAIFFVTPIDSVSDVQYIASRLSETTGKIIASEVKPSGSGRTKTYLVDIQYEYVVADERLLGYRLQRLKMSFSEEDANKLVGQFHLGKDVAVFYAAKRPSYSVLLKSNSLIEYFAALAIALFLLILFYLFFLITLGRFFNFFLNRFVHD